MTSITRFTTGRDDGRSDVQVIHDLVGSADPGTVFTFDELASALRVGCEDRDITIQTVRQAVRRSYTRMLRENARTLQSVVGVGYRVAEAAAHQTLARARQRRSDVQLRRGVQVLEHVRWDEMDANARAAHQGTLLIMSALYQNQRQLHRRQGRIEDALSRIVNGAA